MNCSECKSNNTFLVVDDHIPCGECGKLLTISYWLCLECGYSFRTDGDKYIDGFILDSNMTDDIMRMISDQINSMSDLLTACIKCGSLKVSKFENEYSCPECGFSWEIIKDA